MRSLGSGDLITCEFLKISILKILPKNNTFITIACVRKNKKESEKFFNQNILVEKNAFISINNAVIIEAKVHFFNRSSIMQLNTITIKE